MPPDGSVVLAHLGSRRVGTLIRGLTLWPDHHSGVVSRQGRPASGVASSSAGVGSGFIPALCPSLEGNGRNGLTFTGKATPAPIWTGPGVGGGPS